MSPRKKEGSMIAQTHPQPQQQLKSWVTRSNHQSVTPPTTKSKYMEEWEKSNT